jgi:hypothetical protein
MNAKRWKDEKTIKDEKTKRRKDEKTKRQQDGKRKDEKMKILPIS